MPVLPASSLDGLFELLASCDGVFDGSDEDDGDPIDILQHSLQTADLLARSTDDTDLQLAGLVHDLGHRVPVEPAAPGSPPTAPDHAVRGADLVRALLGHDVARLVELHVPAKRYLVATDLGYGSELSDASSVSLVRQGGAMSRHEVATFAADPLAARAVALRRADDGAKVIGRATAPLDVWFDRARHWLDARPGRQAAG